MAGLGESQKSDKKPDHFGQFLRQAREGRSVLLSDIAQKTKVARSTLELIERGELDLLPAGVYVRGFIRSYARALGTDEAEPLMLYDRAVAARRAADEVRSATPVVAAPPEDIATDDTAPRGRLGLAVFVIILLFIATLTLSLLLRRPPQSGEGLSLRGRGDSSSMQASVSTPSPRRRAT